MHLLDLLMYFVCVSIVWWIMGSISKDLTEEMGGALIGAPIILILTFVYIWLFAWGPNDWDWIDIFNDLKIYIKTSIKW